MINQSSSILLPKTLSHDVAYTYVSSSKNAEKFSLKIVRIHPELPTSNRYWKFGAAQTGVTYSVAKKVRRLTPLPQQMAR